MVNTEQIPNSNCKVIFVGHNKELALQNTLKYGFSVQETTGFSQVKWPHKKNIYRLGHCCELITHIHKEGVAILLHLDKEEVAILLHLSSRRSRAVFREAF